jgi:hypothetical protein
MGLAQRAIVIAGCNARSSSPGATRDRHRRAQRAIVIAGE